MMTEIVSINDSWIQHLARLARDRHYRETTGRTLVGGLKMVREHLHQRDPIYSITMTNQFISKHGHSLPPLTSPFSIRARPCCFDYVTREAAPEGILAEVGLPKPVQTAHGNGRILVLFEIRDPGNLGCLLRSATGLGWQTIVLVGGCADPWSYETIRCSRGASLSSKIYKLDNVADDLGRLLKDYTIVLATASENNRYGQSFPWDDKIVTDRLALVLGNEARGLEGCQLPSQNFPHIIHASIPTENIESLNVAVAGGILMHHLNRNRRL